MRGNSLGIEAHCASAMDLRLCSRWHRAVFVVEPSQAMRSWTFARKCSPPAKMKLLRTAAASRSPLVFKNDDAIRGLRFLKNGILYSDGPRGAGIDVFAESLSKLDYCT